MTFNDFRKPNSSDHNLFGFFPSTEDMKEFFENNIRPLSDEFSSYWSNSVVSDETNENKVRVIEIELAGYGKENIEINYDKRSETLSVKANRLSKSGKETSYSGEFVLAEGTTEEAISSEYVDGMLVITVDAPTEDTVKININ